MNARSAAMPPRQDTPGAHLQGQECLQCARASSTLLQLGLQPGSLMLGCQHLGSCTRPLCLVRLHALPSLESFCLATWIMPT